MLLKMVKKAEQLLIISFRCTTVIEPNVDHETGSSYNKASVRDINAISASRYSFFSIPTTQQIIKSTEFDIGQVAMLNHTLRS